MMIDIRIGTRGSKLALYQANWVRDQLLARFPDLRVELVVIRTESDRKPESNLASLDTRGVFTRDIESALLAGEIDVAVHSLKDLPTDMSQYLCIAATGPRADARDFLVTHVGSSSMSDAMLSDLPEGAVVGTSSMRRSSLLRAERPDFTVLPLRGNIDTRLRKLESGEYDAIVMAGAALDRLGLSVRAVPLDPHRWVPAVAQGIIGVQAHIRDREILAMLDEISDPDSMLAATVERDLLRAVGGGCSVPVGGYGVISGDDFHLTGFVGSPDGTRVIYASRTSARSQAATLGEALAADLRSKGADAILAELQVSVPDQGG